jgi:hypothetical protein
MRHLPMSGATRSELNCKPKEGGSYRIIGDIRRVPVPTLPARICPVLKSETSTRPPSSTSMRVLEAYSKLVARAENRLDVWTLSRRLRSQKPAKLLHPSLSVAAGCHPARASNHPRNRDWFQEKQDPRKQDPSMAVRLSHPCVGTGIDARNAGLGSRIVRHFLALQASAVLSRKRSSPSCITSTLFGSSPWKQNKIHRCRFLP